MIFRYSDFKNFINHAKNYSDIVSFENWNGGNQIILRHDVDFDIYLAYKLFLLEKELGVKSTFFIMTSCFYYNPLSADNRKMLSEIVSNGFEIGLHFDPTVYGDVSDKELSKAVEVEASILSSVTGKKIKAISLHNPSIHGHYPEFKNYINTYNREVFSNEIYISDSRMDFRSKDPYEFVKKARNSVIQVLLHPMHYSENGDDYPEILCKSVQRSMDNIDQTFIVNETFYKQMNGKKLIECIRSKETVK
jgi:hypothetical protein